MFQLTAIWISFLATPRSTSSFTNSRFNAYFLLLLFTRKTTAKPPGKRCNCYGQNLTRHNKRQAYLQRSHLRRSRTHGRPWTVCPRNSWGLWRKNCRSSRRAFSSWRAATTTQPNNIDDSQRKSRRHSYESHITPSECRVRPDGKTHVWGKTKSSTANDVRVGKWHWRWFFAATVIEPQWLWQDVATRATFQAVCPSNGVRDVRTTVLGAASKECFLNEPVCFSKVRFSFFFFSIVCSRSV